MSISSLVQRIRSHLPQTMLRDREILTRRLEKILQRGEGPEKRLARELIALQKRVSASIEEQEARLARRPHVTYPETLPITSRRHEIIQAIKKHQVLIISGETGCGKSTQIPKMCLEAGRGMAGKIGCTQPRRIAATTIARRIAEEMGEEIGLSVGYKIRFTDRTARESYIKIMTDGMLLAETQGDPRLLEYDTLIIDEAHERSLNIDFILGILKTLLPTRPELKVIITSATLDTQKFSEAFDNAPVVVVEGRVYPVEVEYMPIDPEMEETGEVTYVDMAIRAVDTLRAQRRFGDILIFMPTEQDILETCERLEGRQYPGVAILPLFARLPASAQGRVYSVTGHKIVVATNVAETSLTIPGIRYVIDTGLARISMYLPRTRTRSLPINPVSRSSADQRMGRCGRVQHGLCIRLYSEEDYLTRPAFTPPEILRSNLAEVILRMTYLNLGHPATFPFLDSPNPRSIKDGFDLLVELGAVSRDGNAYSLTEKGHLMARMPLDPKISRMMLEAGEEGCVEEVAIIASALSIQDPRERPVEKAAQADQMHAPFKDPESDFITLLNIWKRYHREWETLGSQNRMRKFCKQHFLSFPRMREWGYTHEQITTILREQKIHGTPNGKPESLHTGIHKSILSGFLSNIAQRKEKNIYLAARGREVMIFPGSTLFNRNSPWIVATEMVKTSRLFARTAARIDPEWLEALGKDLCRYHYSDPHWERNRGEVRAFGQVSLYGLPIVSRRSVSYGRINPEEAHSLFIQSALVEGDLKEPLPFLVYNRKLIQRLSSMEDKLRRRDILVSDVVLAEFYSSRLEGICDIPTLKKAIRERGGDDFLRLSDEDLLLFRPDKAELAQYPDRMAIGEGAFDCSYTFAPGKPEDGVTIRIPSGLISGIRTEGLEWGVPGLFREKVTALLKGLPKQYRKQLVPVSRTVDVIVRELDHKDQSLLTALARFIYRKFGADIPASAWSAVEIPEHLRMRVAIVDHRGRELKSGRDLHLLRAADEAMSAGTDSAIWRRAREKWERSDLTTWNFGALPEAIPLTGHLFAYPGLEPGDACVNIRLFKNHREALETHKRGVETLLSLHLAKDLKFLKRSLTLPRGATEGARYFGGSGEVEKALYESLLRDLLQSDIRTEEAFAALAESIGGEMFDRGMAIRDQGVKVLGTYHQTRTALYAIEKANRSNHAVLALCVHIRQELDALMPQDFLRFYSLEHLTLIPRYLKALQVRAERGAHDPEKDRTKMALAGKAIKALAEMRANLAPNASQEKREAVEAYRWMVEEFKVSLFAQELGTPFPVSMKRLEERRKEIERMV